jgi:hypothetical protein
MKTKQNKIWKEEEKQKMLQELKCYLSITCMGIKHDNKTHFFFVLRFWNILIFKNIWKMFI